MKTFLEEYGLVVVAAVIILIFVTAATPIGNAIKDGVVGAVEALTNTLETDGGVTVTPSTQPE